MTRGDAKQDPIGALLDHMSRQAVGEDSLFSEELSAFAKDIEKDLATAFAKERATTAATAGEIAAYLDGVLAGTELDAFEQKLVASAELRSEVAELAVDLPVIEAMLDDLSTESEIAGAAGLRATLAGGSALTIEQQRALFADPALRAEYNRLIRRDSTKAPRASENGSGISMPARAAASTDGTVNHRTFTGDARLHVGSAGRPNLKQIRIKGAPPDVNTLELHGADRTLAYLSLPPPDRNGEITRIVDLNREADAQALEMIRDPLSTLKLLKF